jgi:uroporphyrinogen-III synthase
MRVIVTRPGPQAGKWVMGLRDAGHEAFALPLIEIAPPADASAVTNAWHRLDEFDALMFVSANAADQFFSLRPPGSEPLQWGASLPRCMATGPGTVAALRKAGVPQSAVDAPAVNAAQFDSEALWQVVQGRMGAGTRVLIVRGSTQDDGDAGESAATGSGREWFAERVRERGGAVEFVAAYQRCAPVLGINALALARLAAADGSVWLFSSSEAVNNLQPAVPGQSWGQARAVASHPRIAQAARAAGFGLVLESRPSLPDLIASIESLK